jgi:hypothetical protein
MKLAFIIFAALAWGQAPDLHRNAKVQKLSAHVLAAQSAYDSEMKSWIAECTKKGLQLRPVAGNLMDCMPTTQQSPLPEQPKPAPAKQP